MGTWILKVKFCNNEVPYGSLMDHNALSCVIKNSTDIGVFGLRKNDNSFLYNKMEDIGTLSKQLDVYKMEMGEPKLKLVITRKDIR